MDMRLQVDRHLLRGCCCTEAVVRAGLDMLGSENERLADASAGLCLGIHAGFVCGALAGGAMLLSMFSRTIAATEMIPALAAWFDEEYGMQYGSVNCADIAGPRRIHKAQRCKPLCMAVCEKCAALLLENELIPE